MSSSAQASVTPRRSGAVETIGLVLIWAVVAPLTVVVLGSFFPSVPYLGLADVVSGLAGWFTLVLLVLIAPEAWLLLRHRGIGRIALVAVTGLALVGSGVMTARLMAVGASNGVTINPLSTGPTTSPPDETVRYSEHDGTPLTASVWRPVTSGARDAPVAFFVHGGGWTSGTSTDDNAGLRKQMADEGWLVVSISYTLADENNPTWDVVTDQVACAMAWTAQNAGTYGGDASRFAVLGDSAGGNLAINASYQVNAGDLDTPCGPLPDVTATAVVYPGVSPAAVFDNPAPVAGALGESFVTQYVGGGPEDHPERFASVTSSTYVTGSAPPTFVVQGENDHLVPAGPVYDFVGDAKDEGVDISLLRVPYADHVFDASPIGSQIYAETTLDWLAEQGLTTRPARRSSMASATVVEPASGTFERQPS